MLSVQSKQHRQYRELLHLTSSLPLKASLSIEIALISCQHWFGTSPQGWRVCLGLGKGSSRSRLQRQAELLLWSVGSAASHRGMWLWSKPPIMMQNWQIIIFLCTPINYIIHCTLYIMHYTLYIMYYKYGTYVYFSYLLKTRLYFFNK